MPLVEDDSNSEKELYPKETSSNEAFWTLIVTSPTLCWAKETPNALYAENRTLWQRAEAPRDSAPWRTKMKISAAKFTKPWQQIFQRQIIFDSIWFY